ncbi:unnamed protein product [Urochloa decumbens]|uniref:Glycosyl transferase family 1 domain-containing protein n=1 Tax=Urochloa decumbens TaxID=240449 RepID=A0ABC9FQX7_9POAL
MPGPPPTQTAQPDPKPNNRRRSLLLFLAPPLLAVAVALLLGASTNPLPRRFLRLLLGPKPSVLRPEAPRPVGHPSRDAGRPPCVLWMAPFASGGGYCSEAWSYVAALDAHAAAREGKNFTLSIAHHGDLESPEFWIGLPEPSKDLAYRLAATRCELSRAVVVCHSEPGAWYPPLYEALPCPPTGGVDRAKVVKVVQAVDVEFFDPAKHVALPLPIGVPVMVPEGSTLEHGDPKGRDFAFLSVFKWEQRKGWDVLLRAFLQEFSGADDVVLYLLISAYHSDTNFIGQIRRFVKETGIKEPVEGWAEIRVINEHVPQSALPSLYKAADAFVLPTRGEGWGRPVVEAMAMALPVIVTNWSGPTEYLTEENGYPLDMDRLTEVTEGPFKGHLCAEPSADHLRALMRHVVGDREEARSKGKKAREDMIERNLIHHGGMECYLTQPFICQSIPSRLAQQRLQLNIQEIVAFIWQRLVRGRSYRHLMKEVGYK